MSKYSLSILIPARNEEFLAKTVQDIIEHKRGDTEIIVGLDGLWANPPIKDHKDVTVVFYPESIGQRGMTNQLCRLSFSKYVLKCDAHCAFDEGFDVKLMADMKDDWTVVPTMRNLHVFDHVCPSGHRRYQGPDIPCKICGKPVIKEVIWNPKKSPQSNSYCFDETPHFQYFGEYTKRPEYKKDLEETGLTETMSLQGSAFMMTREKYWELNIGDEEFGSWGSQGLQVALSTWLSGGRVIVNHKTWYAHCFRTQGGSFGFPYPMSGKQVEKAKKLAGNKLFENNWPKQIYPSSWLIDKFWPVKNWSDESRAKITEAGTMFTNLQNKLHGVLGIVPIIPSTMANHTTSMSTNGRGQEMPVSAMGLPSLSSSSTITSKNILSIRDESKVGGVATGTVVTDMIKNGDVLTLPCGKGDNEPRVHKSMDGVESFVDPNLSVSILKNPNPIPTSGNIVDSNLLKDSVNGLGGDIVYDKHIGDVHNTSVSQLPSKSIIFYTDNALKLSIAHAVQKQLRTISATKSIPIVSASLKPMSNMGKNIYLPLKRGYKTMFLQILAALEASTSDVIFFCEHDNLYHPSHFDFTPPDKNTFYYNQNWWKIRSDGFAVHWDADQVSGLCAYREILIDFYRKRIETFDEKNFDRKFEPLSGESSESWKSDFPCLDIRHNHNLTYNKWGLDDFRKKDTAVNFQESTVDKIPGWENLNLKNVF